MCPIMNIYANGQILGENREEGGRERERKKLLTQNESSAHGHVQTEHSAVF